MKNAQSATSTCDRRQSYKVSFRILKKPYIFVRYVCFIFKKSYGTRTRDSFLFKHVNKI